MKRKLLTSIATALAITMTFGISAFAAPKQMSDGQVFDPQFYAQTYPDVVAALGNSETALYQHYLKNGKAEGRLPYAIGTDISKIEVSKLQKMADGGLFDPTYYAQQNPDVVAVVGSDVNSLYLHYVNCGKAEGRLPYAPGTDVAAVTAAATTTPVVVTQEYKNALRKAQSYNNNLHMSKQRLYRQLTSYYGERFPADAAQYAVDNVVADWNANALAKAQSYYTRQNMSKQRVYHQLVSAYGEGFTEAEAQYAVSLLN